MTEPKDRLKMARQKAGFDSPTDAARAFKELNINTLISNENGNRPISRKAAEKYAKLFEVDPGWILFGTEEDTNSQEFNIPVLSMVSAGNLRGQQGVIASEVERWIRVGDLPKGEWIALIVDGDSMDRIAPDGAIILVNRNDDRLIDGKYYIFSLEGGEATFKRYRRDPSRLQPYSTNPDHTSIPANGDLYVFGRVKRVIHDL
jgi:SOS-response transcriptional repressor LexA